MAYCGTLQCWQQTPCTVHQCSDPVYRVCVAEKDGLHIQVAECLSKCTPKDVQEACQALSRREWVFDEKSSPSVVTYWLVEGVSRAVLVFRSENSLDLVARELKALKGFLVRESSDIPWHIVLPHEWSYEQASEYRVRVYKQPVKFSITIGVYNPDGSHRWLDPSEPSSSQAAPTPAKPASIGLVSTPFFPQ